MLRSRGSASLYVCPIFDQFRIVLLQDLMNTPIDHRHSVTCVKHVGNNGFGVGEEVREKLRVARQQTTLTLNGDESFTNHCILDEILSEKKKCILESAVVVDFLKLQTHIT